MKIRKARSVLESIMKLSFNGPSLTRIALALSISLVAIPTAFAQKAPSEQEVLDAAERAQYQNQLQQVLRDKAGYAAAIVVRWEAQAKASGRWDPNYARDLFGALMKLGPENLVAAGEATSYAAMMTVLATGQRAPSTTQQTAQSITPQNLGDFFNDLVYTPVTPCRIVDTRVIASPIVAFTTRSFDVDGTTFVGQGGFDGSCGIPFGVASAVAMNLTVTEPNAQGYFTAWALGSPQPLASILNFTANETIANSSIVPVWGGSGADFHLFVAGATAHAVIDVIGYFAAPVATALDCNTQISADVTVGSGTIYSIFSPSCATGFTVTGGGQSTSTFSPLVSDSKQSGNGWQCQGRNNDLVSHLVACEARCCRVPGR